jgi:hypothetical protein
VGESPASTPPARFGAGVWLTKFEVFAACQALADADRVLARSGRGRGREASALGDLFELFEDRLSAGAQPDPGSRSYSSESELTQ